MAALQLDISDSFDVGSGDWSAFSGTNINKNSGDVFLNLTLEFTDDSGTTVSDECIISPTGTLNIDGLQIKESIYNSPQKYFVRKASDLEVICNVGIFFFHSRFHFFFFLTCRNQIITHFV